MYSIHYTNEFSLWEFSGYWSFIRGIINSLKYSYSIFLTNLFFFNSKYAKHQYLFIFSGVVIGKPDSYWFLKSPPQSFWGVKYLSSSQNLIDWISHSRYVFMMILLGDSTFYSSRSWVARWLRHEVPHFILALLWLFLGEDRQPDHTHLDIHLWFAYYKYVK